LVALTEELMATIQPTLKSTPGVGEFLVTWDGLATGDVGAPVRGGRASDRSYTASGTIGTSTLTIEGTNEEDTPDVPDLTTMLVLNAPGTPSPTALSHTTLPQARQVLEAMRWTRPQVAGGAGASGIKVTMAFRRVTSHA